MLPRSCSLPQMAGGSAIRIVTFEACSSFTYVTAHRIAQSPKATFVTRLQPCRLPNRAARQLPDQSTILRVESSSTDDSRLRGARPEMTYSWCPRSSATNSSGSIIPFLDSSPTSVRNAEISANTNLSPRTFFDFIYEPYLPLFPRSWSEAKQFAHFGCHGEG